MCFVIRDEATKWLRARKGTLYGYRVYRRTCSHLGAPYGLRTMYRRTPLVPGRLRAGKGPWWRRYSQQGEDRYKAAAGVYCYRTKRKAKAVASWAGGVVVRVRVEGRVRCANDTVFTCDGVYISEAQVAKARRLCGLK